METIQFQSTVQIGGSGNIIYNNVDDGIDFQYLLEGSELWILDNVIAGNGGYGIYNCCEIWSGSSVTIQDNTIGEYRERGMDLDGNSSRGIDLEDVYYGSSAKITGVTATTLTFADGLSGGTLEADGPAGTATGGSDTVLFDTTATFLTDGVLAGHTVTNTTDGSTAIVTTVNSEIALNFEDGLSGGTDNEFEEGDAYQVYWNDFDVGDDYVIAFKLSENGDEGIEIEDTDYGSSIQIGGSGNIISDNLSEGIRIVDVGSCRAGTCDADEYYDIFLEYGFNEVTIEDNDVGTYDFTVDGATYELDGNAEDGLDTDYWDFALEFTIQNNTFDGNSEDGAEIEYTGQEGDDFWEEDTNSPREEFPLYTGPTGLVDDNTMNDNGSAGFRHHDDWRYGTSVTITNNTMNRNDSGGYVSAYDLKYGSTEVISGNTITDNGGPGIDYDEGEIEKGSTLTIQDNTISDNEGEGIYLYEVDESSDNFGTTVTIGGSGNIITGNDYDGIFIDLVEGRGRVDILGNTISDNGYNGINVDEQKGRFGGVNISDNTITENGWNGEEDMDKNGVLVYDTDNNGLHEQRVRIGSDNTISENDFAGVYLYEEAEFVLVVGNDITDNEVGVYIYDGDDNRIGHNNISGNTGSASGIHLTDSAYRNMIRCNNITGNDDVGSYGVFNDNEEDRDGLGVDARNNWWSDATGPFHAGNNPDGLEDSVTFFVDFGQFDDDAWETSTCDVPDVTDPTIWTTGAVPDTLSWSGVVNPEDGPFNNGNIHDADFEEGRDRGFFAVEATDYGYFNGIAYATIDCGALMEEILDPVELDFAYDLMDAEELYDWENDLYNLANTKMYDGNDEDLDNSFDWSSFFNGDFQEIDVWITQMRLGFDGEGQQAELWPTIYNTWDDCDNCERDQILQLIAEDMARGTFEVEVTVEDWSGNTTTDTIEVELVDLQMALEAGWNARSTPINL